MKRKTTVINSYEVLQLLDNDYRVLAIRVYLSKSKSRFISFYLNGNLWKKEQWTKQEYSINNISCVNPIIQEIIRSFDKNNQILESGELK